jgi:hypothetical protein
MRENVYILAFQCFIRKNTFYSQLFKCRMTKWKLKKTPSLIMKRMKTSLAMYQLQEVLDLRLAQELVSHQFQLDGEEVVAFLLDLLVVSQVLVE